MAPSLEDRVRDLERFRYTMLGRVNALQQLMLDAWFNILRKSADDLVPAAQELREMWLENAKEPRPFPGVDPVHLDAVAQEYEKALDDLTKELVRLAIAAAPKSDNRQGPSPPS